MWCSARLLCDVSLSPQLFVQHAHIGRKLMKPSLRTARSSHHRKGAGVLFVLLLNGWGCTAVIDGGTGMVDNGQAPAAGGGPGSAGGGAGTASPATPTAGSGIGGSAGQTSTPSAGAAAAGAPTSVPAFEPAPAALRRLTATQFRNSLRDLLGVSEASIGAVEPDSRTSGFTVIDAAKAVSSDVAVEKYDAAVVGAVESVFADAAKRAQLLGCAPALGNAEDACLRSYLERFGRRAWRRPLSPVELDRYIALATSGAAQLGAPLAGYEAASVGLLTSPNHLYRFEAGERGADGKHRYTSYELAARLAFLILNSVPDSALLEQAAAGGLSTPASLRTAAERLLQLPAGRSALGDFAEELLRMDLIFKQAKDAVLYPEYGPALQRAMIADVRGTWESLAFDDEASMLSVFTTAKVVVNRELAVLYGLPTTGLDSNTFQILSLPPDSPRAGLMAKAGLLSASADQQYGSPTLRGQFMRESLTCLPVPAPPPDVDTMLEDPPAGVVLTRRERLAQHQTEPACAGCHALMDPLGFTLENFDAIGRYRTLDNGKPVDASGDVDGTPVTGAKALGAALAVSPAVADCLVRSYYSYATANELRPADASVLAAVVAAFTARGQRFPELLLAIVSHEAFAVVAPPQP